MNTQKQALECLQELVAALWEEFPAAEASLLGKRLVKACNEACLLLAVQPPEDDQVPAADLTDERLQQVAEAAWDDSNRSGSLAPRHLAAFRAVAALAREGWRPIPQDEGEVMSLFERRSNPCRLVVPAAEGEVGELVARLQEGGRSWLADQYRWAAPMRRAANLLEQRPVPASERPWEQEGWCNELGRCWMGDPGHDEFIPSWRLCRPEDAPRMIWSLPHWAISVPTPGDAS